METSSNGEDKKEVKKEVKKEPKEEEDKKPATTATSASPAGPQSKKKSMGEESGVFGVCVVGL